MQAFESLKKSVMEAHCLAHPDLGRPFVLQTDASNITVGAVLLHRQEDGSKKPIG